MTHPRAQPRARLAARAAFTLAALALLGGCDGTRNHGASAGERDAPAGIEASWFVVESRPARAESLADIVASYENTPMPGDARVSDTWRENGLRMIAIPKREVEAFRARLSLVGPAQEQWFGQVPRWTPIIRGPEFDAPFALGMDSGLLRLPPGAMRLLARAWIAPMEPGVRAKGARDSTDASPPESPRAGVRIELMPQHEERAPKKGAWLEPARAPGERTIDAGLAFSRLAWCATLSGEHALVILPEAPGENPSPSSEPAPDAEHPPTLGPGYRPPTTLGEAMLSGDSGGRRVVLIIIPNAPEKYELMR